MKYILACMILLTLSSFFSFAQTLDNATRQYVRINQIYGIKGNISITNPNLNGGRGVFHRVGLTTATVGSQDPASSFVEIGWAKDVWFGAEYYSIIVAYRGSNGQIFNEHVSNPLVGTHTYTVQLEPVSGTWIFYLNTLPVYAASSNFIVANTAVAGGEVVDGFEAMGYAWYSNLYWMKRKVDGSFVYKAWPKSEKRLYQSGYRCTLTSSVRPISFYCYHQILG